MIYFQRKIKKIKINMIQMKKIKAQKRKKNIKK